MPNIIVGQVNKDQVKDRGIEGIDIALNTIEGASSNSATGDGNIKAGTVSTNDLRDGAVTAAKTSIKRIWTLSQDSLRSYGLTNAFQQIYLATFLGSSVWGTLTRLVVDVRNAQNNNRTIYMQILDADNANATVLAEVSTSLPANGVARFDLTTGFQNIPVNLGRFSLQFRTNANNNTAITCVQFIFG